MIKHTDIAGVKLDGIHELGESLRLFRCEHGDIPLVVFKSDIKATYRRIPLHFLWQIKQIISFNGIHRVDRTACFGNRGSQIIFMAFMGLVMWVAIYVYHIAHLKVYVDDAFLFERACDTMYYAPYDLFFPSKQTQLLHLWDKLGIPHEKEKQEFGSVLRIIGFEVDPNAMTVTMDYSSRKELLSLIHDFAITGKKCTLKEFQRIAGHINWALNVFPLLRPGLSALYAKTAGKERDFATIRVNAAVIRELTWVASRVESSTGVHFLKSVEWDPRSADSDAFTFFMDASSLGIAFFLPCAKLAYQCLSPSPELSKHIFFHEALAVCSVFHHFVAASFQSVTHRLVIYTDSSNTVDIFSSL